MAHIAVAGATGVVGRQVMAALGDHTPVALCRSAGVDLVTGQGLAAALVGVDAVIDVSNTSSTRAARSRAFFTAATTNLLAQGVAAGVRHHVCLSIVGNDRVDLGYYQGKQAQERLVLDAAVPYSVLRATQFFEFAGQLLDRMPGPVAVLPRMRMQPVAAVDVAASLVALALGDPVGRAPDLAGPAAMGLDELARATLAARGSRRRAVSVRVPGRLGAQWADGALLPAEPCTTGTTTLADWHPPRG